MAHKCSATGCEFPLPDKYPLDKCPWHMAPGRGPVKIAAALAIAAAGLGGGFAYKKFRTYLSEKKLRKERRERRQRAASASEQEQKIPAARNGATAKSRKRPRKRKTSTTKSKRKPAKPKITPDLP
jgi:hypothetical protein